MNPIVLLCGNCMWAFLPSFSNDLSPLHLHHLDIQASMDVIQFYFICGGCKVNFDSKRVVIVSTLCPHVFERYNQMPATQHFLKTCFMAGKHFC